ncbi:gag-pol fusion protein [Lasius niger]|uniref:Gag-pol fusion protein n=1 Tax=Lasius niger TaxID=67767 RepID=A0A0J7KT45_LASNI|nr:gag-pol fusion protein [Lasius niger]
MARGKKLYSETGGMSAGRFLNRWPSRCSRCGRDTHRPSTGYGPSVYKRVAQSDRSSNQGGGDREAGTWPTNWQHESSYGKDDKVYCNQGNAGEDSTCKRRRSNCEGCQDCSADGIGEGWWEAERRQRYKPRSGSRADENVTDSGRESGKRVAHGIYSTSKYSKDELPALPSRMRPADQMLYSSIFDEIKSIMIDIPLSDLRPTKGKVFKLTRYMGRTASYWPMRPWVTSCYPLYLYHSTVHAMGQVEVARDILAIAGLIQEKLSNILAIYHSDAYRGYLKQISGHCFPKVFTHGPGYMLYVHMHWLTAKCPYTEQQILDDVDEWVSSDIDGKKKQLDDRMCERVLDRVFTTWYKGETDGHLSFNEYCNDYARWGTSGGAPKVRMDGQDYRSMWAWSIYHSTDHETGELLMDYDLYARALKERTSSTIALKEEPAKTREIITTTMASYLRQSYLMYRWGPPRIPSPISSSTWLGRFERNAPLWYGSIDGERFDHCIPSQFICGIVSRLGALDGETEWVAKEIKHMQDLVVH